MTLIDRLRAMFRRQPEEDAWLLPENHVTRAIDSGRDLARYDERPASAASFTEPRANLDVDSYLADLPPLPEPAKRIVISDDEVHAAPERPLAANEKPLEATPVKKKRWWRAA